MLAAVGVARLFVQFPELRPSTTTFLWTGEHLLHGVIVLTGIALVAAVTVFCRKTWIAFRRSDAWQLVRDYAESVRDKTCPMLVIVDDPPKSP